jgi:plastocyanin
LCNLNPKRTCMNLFKTPRRLFRQLLALAALAVSPAAFAATVDINVNAASFTPDPVVINVNDSVKWTWASSFHNSKDFYRVFQMSP